MQQLLITNDHAVLKNHVVYGQPVLPGMAYLDLMYQYLESLGHGFAEWELRDLSIYQALKVHGAGTELRFVENSAADGSVGIRIEGGEKNGAADGERELYASARACRVGAAQYDDSLDRQEIEKSKLRITSTEVYEFQQALGLFHGDFMRVHGTVYADGDNVYVDAEVGDEARAVSSDLIFHPALMDGSVVCAAAGAVSVRPIADDIDSQLRLPVYIESFRASAPLRDRCTARLRTESMHTKGGAFYATVEFYDERGKKVAELRNIATTAGLAGTAVAAAQVAKTDTASRGAETEQDAAAVRQVEGFLLAQMAATGGGLPEGFDSTVHFAASGIDSAGLLGLLQDLEKRIGQPVSPVVLFEYPTIHDLASFLVATYGAALLEVKLAAASVAAEVRDGAETVVGSLVERPLLEARASLPAES